LGFRAIQWFLQLPEATLFQLHEKERHILLRVAASVIDDEARLKIRRPREWISQQTGIGGRTLELYMVRLARLELLVPGDDRLLRLPQFFAWDHAKSPQSLTQNDRQNGGEISRYKEGNLLEKVDSSEELSPKELKPSQSPAREKRAGGVTPEIRKKVWGPVLGKLRRLQEGAPQFRGFTDYDALELLELGEVVVVGCPVKLDEGERAELALRIARAAGETGMLRDRLLRIVYVERPVMADARAP
jgi:hypothetical protein